MIDMKTIFRPFRAFIPHSPSVGWRSVMPENRLGMIVCGAFLGLVAAVVVAKMREPAADAPKPDNAVAAAVADVPTPKADPNPAPTAPPEKAAELPEPITAPNPQLIQLPEPNSAPPAHPPAVPPKDLSLEAKPPKPSDSQVAVKDLPVPPDGFTPAGISLPAPGGETPAPPPSADHGAASASPPPPPSPPSPADLALPPPPAPAPGAVADQPEPKPSEPPSGVDNKNKKAGDGAKDHFKDNKDNKKPEGAKHEKETPAVLSPNNGTSEPPPLPAPPPAPPSPSSQPLENEPPPHLKDTVPPPAVVAPLPPQPTPIKPEPPVSAPESPSAKQDKVTVVIPAPTGPTRAEPPPLASTPAPRPVAVTPPSGAPLVDSWDERTYTAKSGDTFAAISQSEYKTEDYAKALEMYNRNHPRAGDAMRRDGAIALGDRIYIPPSPVLEKRHADVIVRSKPKPVTSGQVGSDGFGAVQADFRSSIAGPVNPTYKVQGRGETLFQIAAQQLHDGNRWGEIAKLNPRASTDGLIVGGTILQMPAASASPAPPLPGP
jgi:hypothetical protein